MSKKRTISIKKVRESGYSWSRKNDSPRGCETVWCDDVQVGDYVVVDNYFTEVISEWQQNFLDSTVNAKFKEQTKQGYEIIGLIKSAYTRDDGVQLYTAICKRETDCQPYIICWNYMTLDGTWGNGTYCNSYDEAIKILKERL